MDHRSLAISFSVHSYAKSPWRAGCQYISTPRTIFYMESVVEISSTNIILVVVNKIFYYVRFAGKHIDKNITKCRCFDFDKKIKVFCLSISKGT